MGSNKNETKAVHPDEAGRAAKRERAECDLRHIRTDLLFELIVEERVRYLSSRSSDEEYDEKYGDRISPAGVMPGERNRGVLENGAPESLRYGALDRNACLLARFFHLALAEQTAETLTDLRKETGVNDVVLTGGVYQNHLLLEDTRKALEMRGFHVLIHSLVPPNDGGICLGQAACGMRQLEKRGRKERCRKRQ